MDFQTYVNIEVEERNNILLEQLNGRLPSYCVWTDEDVERETFETRKKWWEEISKTNKLSAKQKEIFKYLKDNC